MNYVAEPAPIFKVISLTGEQIENHQIKTNKNDEKS